MPSTEQQIEDVLAEKLIELQIQQKIAYPKATPELLRAARTALSPQPVTFPQARYRTTPADIRPPYEEELPMTIGPDLRGFQRPAKPANWQYASPIEKFTFALTNSKLSYLLQRFGKQFANAFARVGETIISHPLSPIGVRQKEINRHRPQAYEELLESGFTGSPALREQLVRTRAAQLAATEKIPKFQIEPSLQITEKAVDVAAGLSSFIAQLALTKRILPKGTSAPIIWEVQNQATGGFPGEGAALRLALGGVGKIPVGSLKGKLAKVGLESGLFAGYRAATGAEPEDIIIAGLIPVAFNAWHFTKQRQHIVTYEKELKAQAFQKHQQRIKRGMNTATSGAYLKADMRIVDKAIAKAKQSIYRDDAFAPAREKWEIERQKALKMIATGKPDQVRKGNHILDFIGRMPGVPSKPIEQQIKEAKQAAQVSKRAARMAPKQPGLPPARVKPTPITAEPKAPARPVPKPELREPSVILPEAELQLERNIPLSQIRAGDIIAPEERYITSAGYYFQVGKKLEVVRVNPKSITVRTVEGETVRIPKKAALQKYRGDFVEVEPKFARQIEPTVLAPKPTAEAKEAPESVRQKAQQLANKIDKRVGIYLGKDKKWQTFTTLNPPKGIREYEAVVPEIPETPKRLPEAPKPAPLGKGPAVARAEAKEPWEMTVEQYRRQRALIQYPQGIPPKYKGPQNEQWDAEHKNNIEMAVKEAKPVPVEVLKEYKSEEWAQEALAKMGKPTKANPYMQMSLERVRTDALTGVQLAKDALRIRNPELAEKILGKIITPEEHNKRIQEFRNHIDKPTMLAGFVEVPMPESVQQAARNAKARIQVGAKNIKAEFDELRFYPKAPPQFRNAVRTDLIGALSKAEKNVYHHANDAIWGDVNKVDIKKSVEILYARDGLSRTKLGKGNPEIPIDEAQNILDKVLKDASLEAIAAADRFKAIHDKYTDKLIKRGVLEEGQRIEDHVRHYVQDYTPEWAPTFGIPTRLRRPFRGYAKKAIGTTKEYRQDQEALLASLMEMEYHNLVEDFVETQVKNYDIKPKLPKEVRRKLFGTDARGYAKVPRPGRIYIHEGKRYRAYTPDIPFSRAIYMTEKGEAALGTFKNVALIPEEMYNTFRDFSQRGSHPVYLLNRATGYWKTMAILSHFPSFNVNNLVGDTWVALMQHPRPLELLSEYDTAIRYLTRRLQGKYAKDLENFIDKHDIKQTFARAELAIGRRAKNPGAWLLRKSYQVSDFRESINRVAYASSLLKAMQRGEGAKLVEAHDWIDTEDLSTEDALGKIAREVLVDYQAQSKPFRRFVRGGIAPFGTWYFKMSRTIWNWFRKHPAKGTLAFMALPIAAAAYNRRKEINELEQQLPDYIRNRVHFVLGENPEGTIRVLSLQLPQDVLIGTKIFSIVVDHSNRVINGEMTPREAAVETMKRWGIREYEGAKYLLTPWIRMYSGLKTGKDPYDKAPVYRRPYNKMTWDEKAVDISAYIVKTAVPFLALTIQTYEKGLPADIGLQKLWDRWAGKAAVGIYDINKKGQVVLEKDGKKTVLGWEDIHKINRLMRREYKYLGRLEDDFVASEKLPLDFLSSDKAKASLLKIYDTWAQRIPELKKVEDKNERLRITINSLGERLTARVSKPRVLQKWYQVKIARAKSAAEKKALAKQYAEVRKQRLIEVLKTQAKTAREIELTRKINKMLQSR